MEKRNIHATITGKDLYLKEQFTQKIMQLQIHITVFLKWNMKGDLFIFFFKNTLKIISE